jgi:hypothetical protein
MRDDRVKAIERRSYHRRAERFSERGLTRHGAIRQRRPSLTVEDRRKANQQKWLKRSARLLDAGLTTRGRKRKIALSFTARMLLRTRIAAAAVNCDFNKQEIDRRVAEFVRNL